jgi:cytochrome c
MPKVNSRPLPLREGVGGGATSRFRAERVSPPFLTFPLKGGRDFSKTARSTIWPIIVWVLAILIAAVLTQSQAGELPAGDPTRGETIYHKCQGCHSIDRNRVGPKHLGLFGRQAGSLPDFDYSEAMKNSGILWNEQTLDAFLADPRGVVPGTKMTYAGIKSAQDRADLIAYLKEVTKE